MHRAHNPSINHGLRASAIALACLAVGGVAHAQSSVSAYGLIDVSAGQFQTPGSAKLKRLDSGNMSTSYIGFKGSEDLGGGLRANFQLESFIGVDTGGAGRVTGVDAFWARNANVSLSGGFGTIKMGRQGPPLFVSTLLFNAFSDSFGFSPAIRQYYSLNVGTPNKNVTPLVGDSGWNNAIGYSLPSYGGLSATVLVAAGENAATSKGKNVGGNVLYFGGPVALTAAWQNVKTQGVGGAAFSGAFASPALAGFASQTSYQVGGSFDAGLVKLFAQYGKIKTDAANDVTTTNFNFGAKVPLGAGAILAQYGNSKIETQGVSGEKKSQIASAGYDYFLSKRTDLYAVLMLEKFTAKNHGSTYAVGVKHTF
jgi:predicted porin